MGEYVARAEIDVSGTAPDGVGGADVERRASRDHVRRGGRLRLAASDRQIVWRGEWEGKKFEDHGRVIELEDGRSRGASSSPTSAR